MILATGENETMFTNHVSIIVLAGAFNEEFEELLSELQAEGKKWGSVRKQANESALDILKKKYKKLKSQPGKAKFTDKNKSQVRSMLAFSKIFKRFFTDNKL